NPDAIKSAQKLCDACNMFGYGEIKPQRASAYGNSLIDIFKAVTASNFRSVLIEGKEDVWPAFKAFLGAEEEAA
ncbi:MAG TPA: DUF444 family protein, partial [Deltaproteobacteria bacterium]|nr:DUF444 family protein [Deltaproteobacteria bacterium]